MEIFAIAVMVALGLLIVGSLIAWGISKLTKAAYNRPYVSSGTAASSTTSSYDHTYIAYDGGSSDCGGGSDGGGCGGD